MLAQGPCPDFKPDEFGRYPSARCLVLHSEGVQNQKEFSDEKEALGFYGQALEAAPKREGGFTVLNLGDIYDVKLESK